MGTTRKTRTHTITDYESGFTTSYLRAWVIAVIILAVVAVLATGITWASVAGEQADCRQKGHGLGVATRWEFPSGCYLRLHGQWVPYSAYIDNEGN